MKTQSELINELRGLGYLKSARIEAALNKIDRAYFVPAAIEGEAYADAPLPIGYGQTTSQPLTIVFMLELAAVGVGDSVLEIGTGSGWQTALLAELVGPQGRVTSVERIKKIHEFAKENLNRYGYGNIELVTGDGSSGYERGAPYDVIIAGAEAAKIPPSWRDQIKVGGRIVFPMANSVWRISKKKDGGFQEDQHHGFIFVPLVEEK